MKKIVILMMTFCLFVLSSCSLMPAGGPGGPSKTIKVAPYLDNEISLNLSVDSFNYEGHNAFFGTEKNLDMIASELSSNNLCEVKRISSFLVISVPTNGVVHFYTIFSKGDDAYHYQQPSVYLFSVSNPSIGQVFLAPAYYLESIENIEYFPIHFESEWNKITCTEEEFISFYSETNMFVIESASNKYTLSVSSDVHNFLHSKDPFSIEFKYENDSVYVHYEIEE